MAEAKKIITAKTFVINAIANDNNLVLIYIYRFVRICKRQAVAIRMRIYFMSSRQSNLLHNGMEQGNPIVVIIVNARILFKIAAVP